MCSRAIYLRGGKTIFDGDVETAVETYLMDMRSEQAAALEQQMHHKTALNDSSIAFGTNQGRIISVSACAEDELRSWFKHGERIFLDVEAWLSDDLMNPIIAVSVHDMKGFLVAGIDSRQTKEPVAHNGAEGTVLYRFSFDAIMLPGTYPINVRILDFPLSTGNLLIEKQVNAISLEILDNGHLPQGRYGAIGLVGSACEEIRPSHVSDVHKTINAKQ